MQRTILASSSKQSVCFLCEKEAPKSSLRQAMTMQLNRRVNECAQNLNDGKLLAKLSGGDVVAQELKYHSACLIGLYDRERTRQLTLEKDKHDNSDGGLFPLTFSELIAYITETRNNSDGPSVFRLADILNLYRYTHGQLHQAKGQVAG